MYKFCLMTTICPVFSFISISNYFLWSRWLHVHVCMEVWGPTTGGRTKSCVWGATFLWCQQWGGTECSLCGCECQCVQALLNIKVDFPESTRILKAKYWGNQKCTGESKWTEELEALTSGVTRVWMLAEGKRSGHWWCLYCVGFVVSVSADLCGFPWT